ncbi:MAG TPA: hypothetical protein VK961_08720 [Chthoniobacter sp.]|nr:hypothetical protein [Chthoniobacter sp.]
MNKPVVLLLFVAALIVTIAGEIERQRSGWNGGGFFISMIGAVFCLAFGRMLLLHHVLESQPIKLGSETLPPGKDVAAVLVHGSPIPDEARKNLLKAIRRAKRATKCGSVSKELPFQIVDHWGGVWNLQAYEETSGTRGFSSNRVFYSGRAAAMVATCVGL